MSTNSVGELFSATHVEFASWYPRLWAPLGDITVAVSRPARGERVLDACCGSGASAVPAAQAVGPDGVVDAVDLAATLLTQGRATASALGLEQLRFVHADVTTWHADEQKYDLVQCCYGIFFFPDMDAGGRHLVSLLRPGGRLVVSTWIAGGMDALVAIARDAALPDRPHLGSTFNAPDPRQRVNTREGLESWLHSIGLTDVALHQTDFRQPLHPDDAWRFFLGAAPRRFVVGMNASELERVRQRFRTGLIETGFTHLDASTLIGVGRHHGVSSGARYRAVAADRA